MAAWHADWSWGLPLIVLNVVIHVLGLGVINEQIVGRMTNRVNPQHLTALFVVIMAAATVMVTVLHAIEGTVWAVAYLGLGALPDIRSAMLYSLSAITSNGHARIFLDPHWQMMGALEALNGMIPTAADNSPAGVLISTMWATPRCTTNRSGIPATMPRPTRATGAVLSA